ncbi:MAG: aminodeoxychorismate/anthranilate synthase component II [Bacteroidia bacterium]|nr:MAG: aminodeoxychorismate/anthranilate synthase component II [Bacteroidia bacterium]
MRRLLLLDNYDSFTFNLYHYFEKYFDGKIDVIRNDEIDVESINLYDVIVLSPGPKLPKNAGKMMEVIRNYYCEKPLLGVCLGMQGIAEFFGSRLEQLGFPEHGQSKKMMVVKEDNIFKNCPLEFNVGRYHSWGVKKEYLSNELELLSIDEKNWVMSFKHKVLPIYGVQFHPESILTEYGEVIIQNFLKIAVG